LYPDRIDLALPRAWNGGWKHLLCSVSEASVTRHQTSRTIDETAGIPSPRLSFRTSLQPDQKSRRKCRSPDVWLLGSSGWSAELAAQFGLPYAFAHFIGPEQTVAALATIACTFRPSKYLREPRAILTLV